MKILLKASSWGILSRFQLKIKKYILLVIYFVCVPPWYNLDVRDSFQELAHSFCLGF